MSTYFVDTSALARRYIKEVGHNWVRGWSKQSSSNKLIIASTTPVEMFSLLARRTREGNITASSASRIRALFLKHLGQEYIVERIDSRVLISARDLVLRHPLTALDGLQLACAMFTAQKLSAPIIFVSADKRLLKAASGEGLIVDDPALHP